MSKAELGLLFKSVLTTCGQRPNLAKVNVFDEPHKRYNPATQARERHKHIIFKMLASFAHLRVQRQLALHGVHGKFSFNLVGYVEYLRYCMMPSAKKLHADLDLSPWSWPSISSDALLALRDKQSPQMAVRNGGGRAKEAGGPGRKCKLMTFSEISDAFVEGRMRTERDAWKLAKTREVAGDDTLYSSLGTAQSVAALVTRVRQAWQPECMSQGSLMTEPDFPLSSFVPLAVADGQLAGWVRGGWREQVLIMRWWRGSG